MIISRMQANILAMVSATLLFVVSALAQDAARISAPDAFAKAEAGELVLIDIRSRDEWKETGIASVAVPVSMHEPTFLDKLANVKLANPGKQIALICASGGRSAWLQGELRERGPGETIDVSEGMMGHPSNGPGWIARGLKIKPYDG